ncbi:MAG: thiosulfate oxidation carrier complex protein SoxZ [Gammaproteobacteria bacterium]|nr:thiosulfate oxidation carrier complex protein SoxZ [Gammaproteobacteria bacterium]
MASIKVRAKAEGDVVTVKALMSHPMQQEGQKNSKTGEPIPPNYITEVKGVHNGNTVMTAYWSGAISKNPYLSFSFKGGKAGDNVTISWVDNNGKSDSTDAPIK